MVRFFVLFWESAVVSPSAAYGRGRRRPERCGHLPLYLLPHGVEHGRGASAVSDPVQPEAAVGSEAVGRNHEGGAVALATTEKKCIKNIRCTLQIKRFLSQSVWRYQCLYEFFPSFLQILLIISLLKIPGKEFLKSDESSVYLWLERENVRRTHIRNF